MLAPHPVSAETFTESIPAEKLHAHPANPESRLTGESIDELVASIQEFGQREPVRVRTKNDPVGHFEILSGHRRAEACRRLDLPVMCLVVDADDHEALREVMLGNASREDLNAIERAELLQVMIDAGVNRAEAGRLFGLTSESGIKNTLRLMKLPPSIRKMVESGKMPARAARMLVPWAEATMMLDELAKGLLDDEWALNDFITSNEWRPDRTEYRPMDGTTKYSPSWQHDDAVRGFDVDALSAKDRAALGIVTLPLGDKGKLIEVAQNVELFDKLNEPHVTKRSGYGGSTAKKPKATADKPLTPAEQKAEAKRKAKEADERLTKRLPIWRRRLMRCTLATHVPRGHAVITSTLPWLIAANGMDSMQWICRAAKTLGCATKKENMGKIDHCIASVGDGGNVEMIDRLWRIMVWPQWIQWPTGQISSDMADLTRELPAKMPLELDSSWRSGTDSEFEMMFTFAGVTIQDAWDLCAVKETPQRELFKEFLDMHTTAQLLKLGREWKLDVFDTDKKSHLVTSLMNAHSADAELQRRGRRPLPKCLEVKAKGKR